MNKVVFSLVAGLIGLAVTPASAAPIGNLSGIGVGIGGFGVGVGPRW